MVPFNPTYHAGTMSTLGQRELPMALLVPLYGTQCDAQATVIGV